MITYKKDQNSWIVISKETNNNVKSKHYGEEQEKILGYFSSIDTMWKYLIDKSLLSEDILNLKKIKDDLEYNCNRWKSEHIVTM